MTRRCSAERQLNNPGWKLFARNHQIDKALINGRCVVVTLHQTPSGAWPLLHSGRQLQASHIHTLRSDKLRQTLECELTAVVGPVSVQIRALLPAVLGGARPHWMERMQATFPKATTTAG